MLTSEQIAEIRERCEKATPGPWAWKFNRFGGDDEPRPFGYATLESLVDVVRNENEDHIVLMERGSTVFEEEDECFSDFIRENKKTFDFLANARQDIPALLDHVAEQDGIIEQLRERLDRAKRVQ